MLVTKPRTQQTLQMWVTRGEVKRNGSREGIDGEGGGLGGGSGGGGEVGAGGNSVSDRKSSIYKWRGGYWNLKANY